MRLSIDLERETILTITGLLGACGLLVSIFFN